MVLEVARCKTKKAFNLQDFLKSWEAEVQAVSQNNYNKVYSPGCCEKCPLGTPLALQDWLQVNIAPPWMSDGLSVPWWHGMLHQVHRPPEVFYCLCPDLSPPVGDDHGIRLAPNDMFHSNRKYR